MRGSRDCSVSVLVFVGSIPAHAGEPIPAMMIGFAAWVYPRACGGAHRGDPSAVLEAGLSPRMRGSRLEASLHALGEGSIPAHAGEPVVVLVGSSLARVYPRACGGAIGYRPMRASQRGLSPRMRGSLYMLCIRFMTHTIYGMCVGISCH